jgi:hypothetical protein
MTTTLNTSRSGNTMVLLARRGFLHACIFWYYYNHLPRYCLTAGLYNAIHTMQVLGTSAHMKQDIV